MAMTTKIYLAIVGIIGGDSEIVSLLLFILKVFNFY